MGTDIALSSVPEQSLAQSPKLSCSCSEQLSEPREDTQSSRHHFLKCPERRVGSGPGLGCVPSASTGDSKGSTPGIT